MPAWSWRNCPAPPLRSFSDDLPRWQALSSRTRRNSFGGDCYAYGLLALGQIDIIAEADLKIWDWAALTPVIEGAGGRITDWSGNQLAADGDGRALAVGDPGLLEQARYPCWRAKDCSGTLNDLPGHRTSSRRSPYMVYTIGQMREPASP